MREMYTICGDGSMQITKQTTDEDGNITLTVTRKNVIPWYWLHKKAFRRKFLKQHVANRRFLKRINDAFEDNMKKLMGRHYFPPSR